MKNTLYEKLTAYAGSGIYPFCMPGHKRNFHVPGVNDPYMIDITEVDGFDNLHDPSGILKEMQARLCELYQVPHAFLSVNGSSAGMLAAVTAVPPGGICVARNCHKSVFDAVSLGNRKVFYAYPEELFPDSMIFGGIRAETVERILERHSSIKAVVITSPTYEGFVSDVRALADTVHKYGALLIVDEAHGAHFPYHESFPVSSVSLGADIVVQSLHKTLPSLNQTALIFVNGDAELARRVERRLSMFTTTSPSYGLLASIEYCTEWCAEQKEKFDEYVSALERFRQQAADISSITLLGRELIGQYGIYDTDPGKLVFLSDHLTGCDLGRYLLKEHKLQMEAAGPAHVLAMTSVMDTQEGFQRLLQGLKCSQQIAEYPGDRSYSEKQMERIALAYVEKPGGIYSDFIYLYPPGCPVVAPGEVFTKEIRDKVAHYIEMGLEIIEWERSSF